MRLAPGRRIRQASTSAPIPALRSHHGRVGISLPAVRHVNGTSRRATRAGRPDTSDELDRDALRLMAPARPTLATPASRSLALRPPRPLAFRPPWPSGRPGPLALRPPRGRVPAERASATRSSGTGHRGCRDVGVVGAAARPVARSPVPRERGGPRKPTASDWPAQRAARPPDAPPNGTPHGPVKLAASDWPQRAARPPDASPNGTPHGTGRPAGDREAAGAQQRTRAGRMIRGGLAARSRWERGSGS